MEEITKEEDKIKIPSYKVILTNLICGIGDTIIGLGLSYCLYHSCAESYYKNNFDKYLTKNTNIINIEWQVSRYNNGEEVPIDILYKLIHQYNKNQ